VKREKPTGPFMTCLGGGEECRTIIAVLEGEEGRTIISVLEGEKGKTYIEDI
jgi:hypothetical protein